MPRTSARLRRKPVAKKTTVAREEEADSEKPSSVNEEVIPIGSKVRKVGTSLIFLAIICENNKDFVSSTGIHLRSSIKRDDPSVLIKTVCFSPLILYPLFSTIQKYTALCRSWLV